MSDDPLGAFQEFSKRLLDDAIAHKERLSKENEQFRKDTEAHLSKQSIAAGFTIAGIISIVITFVTILMTTYSGYTKMLSDIYTESRLAASDSAKSAASKIVVEMDAAVVRAATEALEAKRPELEKDIERMAAEYIKTQGEQILAEAVDRKRAELAAAVDIKVEQVRKLTADQIIMSQLNLAPGVILATNRIAPDPLAESGEFVSGWLLCDGGTIPSATKYENLRKICGTNVPDLRGMFLRGAGANAIPSMRYANDEGRLPGSHQEDSLESHSHMLYLPSGNDPSTASGFQYARGATDPGNPWNQRYFTNATGGDETRPNNYAVSFIIKY